MKDELIVMYYCLSKCCNKIQHKTLEGIFTAKIANIKKFYYYFFFVFPIYKGLDIKVSLMSAEGYKNAGVSHLIIKETDEFWVSMKDVGD